MDIKEWLGADNQLGIDIWNKKYRHEEENFEEWVERVSGGNTAVAELIKEKKFLFGGRILANRGLHHRGKKITYSNCYVIEPPEDSIESIFDCAKKLARTFSYGGGCGIDISKLAPNGAKVNNAAKETSGSVSFMDLYSMVTQLIGQNGRRGALMISLDCNHPDLEEFIDIKNDLDRVTKANISIRITDEFMQAVKNHENYDLSFVREATGETITKTVNAYEVFHRICENNWNMAEPGFLFWDRIEDYNLLSNTKDFRYAGVNPCAEEPLPAGGSCLLGSINLAEFVKQPFTIAAEFDTAAFRYAVKNAVIAMNEVLDEGLELHPLQEQRDSVRDWRQVGLGIFGLADMLIKMGLTYGDEESLHLVDFIGYTMANEALVTSARLAKEYGAFTKCNVEEIITTPFFLNNTDKDTRDLVLTYGLRNSQLLTCAPTGSISTMLGVSGGIEPIFANSYQRKTESLHGETTYYKVYTKIVDEFMKANNIKEEEDLPDYFVTAGTLKYKQRVDMQAMWQDHIDASISSTVNLPNEATIEDVENLYMYAWEQGLKGITIYRDGCARTGILTTNDDANDKAEPTTPIELPRGWIIQANDDVVGKKRKLMTGCGSLHCTAFFDPVTGQLMETYLSKGSTGGCNNFMIGLSRMISLAARAGCSIEDIIDQLSSCGSCPSYAVKSATTHATSKGSCCPMAIGYALKDMYDEMMSEITCDEDINIDIPHINTATPIVANYEVMPTKNRCPQCGEELYFEGGCNICKSCGWSKCD